MTIFKVENSEEGKRLDEVIFARGLVPSRSKGQALIKKGLVTVNGKERKAHYPLEAGDEIEVGDIEPETTSLTPQNIPLNIVYEDEDILVLDKPAGLVVHPGNGNPDGTIANALVYAGKVYDDGTSLRPGIVHRIDKDTSGLLCVAKTERAFLGLSKQLADHSMSRKYCALVLGNILEDEGKIDAPIGRDKKNPMRYAVDLKGKESVTFFTVERRFKSKEATLIRCRLLTGRTHQIRVHLDYIGHPILGDPLYGKGNRKLFDEGQLLHAYELTLTHPVSGKKMTFESPLPKRMLDAIETLGD